MPQRPHLPVLLTRPFLSHAHDPWLPRMPTDASWSTPSTGIGDLRRQQVGSPSWRRVPTRADLSGASDGRDMTLILHRTELESSRPFFPRQRSTPCPTHATAHISPGTLRECKFSLDFARDVLDAQSLFAVSTVGGGEPGTGAEALEIANVKGTARVDICNQVVCIQYNLAC